MIDPNEIEVAAMQSASYLAGAYLEELKKTDMMQMSKEEWMTFIEVVCGGYAQHIAEANRKLEDAQRGVVLKGYPDDLRLK